MVILFGVPKEHSEDVRTALGAYSDLIDEVKVGDGELVNVSPEFTEEIPARFFHILLKKDIKNRSTALNQIVTSLYKILEMYVSDPGPNILLLDRDLI